MDAPSTPASPWKPPAAAAAGWYPDPASPTQARYWDGRQWAPPAAPQFDSRNWRPPAFPKLAGWVGWVTFLLVFAALNAAGIAVAGTGLDDTTKIVTVAAVGYIPLLWWAHWIARRQHPTSSAADTLGLRLKGVDFAWAAVGTVAALTVQGVLAMIILLTGIPFTSNIGALPVASINGLYDPVAVVVFIVVAVAAAPFVEEVVFRGVAQRSLAATMPMWAVIPVQGIVFGAMHIDPAAGAGNIGRVVVLAGAGCTLGAVAWLSGRITAAIGVHVAYNAIAILAVVAGLGS